MTAQQELAGSPIDTTVGQTQEQPSLVERPVNPDLGNLERGRQELVQYIKPSSGEETEDVQDDDGQTLLHGSIKSVAELSLPGEVIKDEEPKWFHFHKHIGNAVTWIVEQILRRDKKETRKGKL